MRGKNKTITALLGGAVLAVQYGSIMVYDKATGLAVMAHDEDSDLFMLMNSTKALGDAVTLKSIKTLDESEFATIAETCSRGDVLYLDEQTTAGAATGKLKKTAGNAKKALFIADDACLASDARIPVISIGSFLSYDKNEGLLVTIGGTKTLTKGAIVTLDIATRLVTNAFDEDVLMFVAMNGGVVGEEIRIKPILQLSEEWTGLVTETVAVGDSLYLDEQANEGASTGKLKKTAGSTTLAIMIAGTARTGAGAISFYSITNVAGKA